MEHNGSDGDPGAARLPLMGGGSESGGGGGEGGEGRLQSAINEDGGEKLHTSRYLS
jgi:hypothetical protein